MTFHKVEDITAELNARTMTRLNGEKECLYPEAWREDIRVSGKVVMRHEWTEAFGYPPHAVGYVQYSPRPYTLWQGCDGSADGCLDYLTSCLLGKLDLRLSDMYKIAYPVEAPYPEADRLGALYAKQVVVPGSLTADVIAGLLHDLNDMNKRSLSNVIETSLRLKVPHLMPEKPYWEYDRQKMRRDTLQNESPQIVTLAGHLLNTRFEVDPLLQVA